MASLAAEEVSPKTQIERGFDHAAKPSGQQSLAINARLSNDAGSSRDDGADAIWEETSANGRHLPL